MKVENKEKAKTPPPQEGKQNETGKKNEHVTNKKLEANVKIVTSRPAGFTCKPKEPEISNEVKSSREINSAQNNSNKSDNVKVKNEETNVSLKKEAAEAETLARLQEAAENVVLSAMTAEVQIP